MVEGDGARAAETQVATPTTTASYDREQGDDIRDVIEINDEEHDPEGEGDEQAADEDAPVEEVEADEVRGLLCLRGAHTIDKLLYTLTQCMYVLSYDSAASAETL